MLKKLLKKLIVFLVISSAQMSLAQTPSDIEKLGNLINDAVFFTRSYVTPATDAAVYQASNGWMNTPKKAELWDVNVSLHGNMLFVPKSNRIFMIANSDFKFFTIPAGNQIVEVQTALGNNTQIPLSGNIGGQDIVVKTPEGINTETVHYAYIQASVGLWFGTEISAKFSPKIKLKKFDYQVYGIGLKHNFDQYFPTMAEQNLHAAAMISYGKEDLSLQFLDAQTPYGNLGLSGINSLIDTYQFQINFSKQFSKFELATGLIYNSSNFTFKLDGEPGTIENSIPVQQILNTKLKELDTTKANFLGEISGRYPYQKFYFQATIGIGKFVNSNISVQYQLN